MLSALILAALIKLNLAIEKPHVPAIVFTVLAFIMGILMEHPFIITLISTPINLGLSYLFFKLLKMTEGQGSWWLVVIFGIGIFIGLSFIR